MLFYAVSNLNQSIGGGIVTSSTAAGQMVDTSKTVSSANLPAVLASLPLGQQYELLKSVSGELVAVQTTNNTNKPEVSLDKFYMSDAGVSHGCMTLDWKGAKIV